MLCLIKVSLINFWDVPRSSAGTAVAEELVQLGNHFAAKIKSELQTSIVKNGSEHTWPRSACWPSGWSSSGAGVDGMSHSSVGGTTHRSECLSNTSMAGHLRWK